MRFWNNTQKSTKLNTSLGACTQLETTPRFTTTAQTNPEVEEVRVDMAGMKVESKPVELVTSVGSCVAICLHDPANKCGGLAHVMLPDSSGFPHELLPAKFADTAVPALAKAVRICNGQQTRLTAKIAGGANMFPNLKCDIFSVGEKNVEAVKTALTNNRIRIVGEDVGGCYGRRVSFNVITGVATIRRYKGELKTI